MNWRYLYWLPFLFGCYLAHSAPRRPAPALGSFSAPVKFQVTYNGVTYEFNSPSVTFAPVGRETVRAISGTGTFLPVGVIPPPPNPPTVTGYSSSSVTSGASFQILGSNFAGSPTVTWNGQGVAVSAVTATSLTATAPTVTAAATAPVIVIQGGQNAQGPALTVNPQAGPNPQPPPNVMNVRNYGVKGDGATIDRTALNSLIQSAPAGATLYFPAGTYLTDDALKVYRDNLSFLGDGDTSIIKSVQGSYHFQIGHGGPVFGIAFRKLQFLGTPGQYMADGTSRGGILNFGSKGTVFEDLLFRGCAEPILAAGVPGTTAGAIINRCRFLGWGRMCIFCNGGEQVTSCQLIQDDPNLFGERSSHGFYIHGGASHVLVADTEISGARKYAIQVYSESEPSVTDDVQLLRLNIHDCANGIITAHGNAQAGLLTHGLIEGCRIGGIYAGSSIALKNGHGLIVRNNTIDGNSGSQNGHTGAGIYLGVWAPYEPGFDLIDVQVTGNTVRNVDRGVWALNSNGGTFQNCIVSGNLVSGNRMNYDITGSGVTVLPGRPPTAIKGGKVSDTRPSNDSSLK
jgi:parallel beta-helix repeat protein